MKIEELIEGEIYVAFDVHYNWTFRCTNKEKPIETYLQNDIGNNRFEWRQNIGDVNYNTNSAIKHYRQATEREKQIFLASEAAGKYVELPVQQINNTYSIY